MATVVRDARRGVWYLRFYFRGRRWMRSLGRLSPRAARQLERQAAELLELVRLGRAAPPAGVELGDWVVSGGRLEAPAAPAAPEQRLGRVIASYLDTMPAGTKAATTLATERIHLGHLERHFGAAQPLAGVDGAAIAGYVRARLAAGVSGPTIRKELATWRLLWRWAGELGLVSGEPPGGRLRLPRPAPRPPFRAIEELGDSDRESLFLRAAEIEAILGVVESRGPRWLAVMVALAAWTGMRRSELVRVEGGDVDLERGVVTVRERKRVHDREGSFRQVPLHPRLLPVLRAWVSERGRGRLFSVSAPEAGRELARVLQGTVWEVVPGWHTFRHSFASGLAARGVDQRMIDAWMGHQTEEQRRRYRHLFPESGREAIGRL